MRPIRHISRAISAGAIPVLCVTLTAGCTHGSSAARTSSKTASSPAVASTESFPVLAQSGQAVSSEVVSLAQLDGVIVGVGWVYDGRQVRPLFLRSSDDGASWQPGTATSTAATATLDDYPLRVVAGHGEFVAIGSADESQSLWTSKDGRAWTRQSVDRTVFDRLASVSSLATTSTGFVAVGTENSRAAAWTSTNGLTWVQSHGQYLAASPLDSSMESVAAGAGTTIAVGTVQDETKHATRPAVWRSTDGGITWAAVAIPATLTGHGFAGYLHGVTWSGSSFVAVGDGGDENDGVYSGVLARSVDGTVWTADYDLPGLKAAPDETNLVSVVANASTVIAAGRRTTSTGGATALVISQTVRSLTTPAVVPAESGTNQTIYGALLTPDNTYLLTGSVVVDGRASPRIWRGPAGAAPSRVDLSFVTANSTPRAWVTGIAFAPGGYLAAGTSGSLAVVWHSTDCTTWGTPTQLSADPTAYTTTVVHGSKGWIILGAITIGITQQPTVWTSPDGRAWQQTPATTFGDAGPFSYGQLSGAASIGAAWVVVGESTTNGTVNQSAAVWLSSDDKTWTRSTSDTVQTVTQSDGSVVAIHDLRGDVNGTRAMSAVTTTSEVLMAVGSAQIGINPEFADPAAWTSADGLTWRLHQLPLPTAMPSSSPSSVVSAGPQTVAFGSGSNPATSSNQLFAWTSSDTGQTWTVHPVGPEQSSGTSSAVKVLAVAGGFFAAGEQGRGGSQHATFWFSTDGATWRAVAIADPRVARATDVTVLGCSPSTDPGRVTCVVSLRSPGSTSQISISQPVK